MTTPDPTLTEPSPTDGNSVTAPDPAPGAAPAGSSAAGPAVAAPRAFRKTREGLVVSDKMDKTVVVALEDRVQHAL